MLFVAAQCFSLHIVYGIYDLRFFFKINRPERCECGALEWRIEQNGPNHYPANVENIVSS